MPCKGLVNKPFVKDIYPPSDYSTKNGRLKIYYARLDLMHAIVKPDQANLDSQIEIILDWTNKATTDETQVMYNVNWIGGDMRWVSMDTLGLHDPYLVVKYVI